MLMRYCWEGPAFDPMLLSLVPLHASDTHAVCGGHCSHCCCCCVLLGDVS